MKRHNISGLVSLVPAVLVLILGLSSAAAAIVGDLNSDDIVDWLDIGILRTQWLASSGSADINLDNNVDFADFALLIQNWTGPGDPNLVGWYKLDEDTGTTANDSSSYGYDGTLSDGASWEPAGGKYAGAARFGGGNDRVATPTTGISRSKGTIALWGRLEGLQTQHYRFFFGDRTGGSDTNRIQLYMKDNTYLNLGLADSHTLHTNIMDLSSTNTWYHIAMTWGGGGGNSYVVYVDGVEKATGTHNAIGVLTPSADIGNSGEPSPVGGFNGLIDEVRIYNRVLPDTEIANLAGIAVEIASNPSPGDGTTGVDIDADLSWTAGEGATSHDVYFGTDSTPDAGEFIQNQPGTTYDPGTMAYDTTYYWQIDEHSASGTAIGDVWSFTTEAEPLPPGQAGSPSPGNGVTNVSVDADLSWSAGSGATSHDVYFGTDSTPDSGEFIQNQTGTTYDPGTMNFSTTYYWRIDEKNAYGTTTGAVWSFTTEAPPPPPGQASSPSPGNGAIDVSINANLSWTAGAGATSHDVYFGTDSSPDGTEFQGNQTGTTFDPGTMDVNTIYYWRIDEVNAGGTTTGFVWSFTTVQEAEGPGQADMPYPSDGATDIRTTTAYFSWRAGEGATSHDVYFGTDSSPDTGEFQGNQTSITFEPGTMAEGTTYYWRIDEKNAGGTTAGEVWSFTTSVFPDVDDLKWDVVKDLPWDSPDRLNHFDNFIAINGAHPRLLLTQAKVDDLKTKITSGIYQDIWNVIENKADGYLSSNPRNNPGSESDTRSDGDVVPWLAMAYLMTDDTAYLNKAVSWMTTVCDYSEWDGNHSLGAGHCLMGVSLSYDWLCNAMTSDQRDTILNGTSGNRGLTYFAGQMANGSPQHKERYLANHCQVEYGGLAAAGFALYNEVGAAEDWLRKAYNIFDAAFRISGNDGSCTEGHQYYGLKTEFQMHFDKMAKELLGRDFYDESEWLKNIGNFILYCNLPDFTSSNCVMRYGDTDGYNYHSHGPVYQMFNIASEYYNPYFQWLALETFDRSIGTTDRMGWANLLWCDDTITSTPPDTLPTFRHFEDTGWVTSRSDWGSDAVMVGYKCGPFHGHAVQALYDEMTEFQQLNGGHGHPDVSHFNVYAYGRWLAKDDGYSRPKWTYYHSTMLIGPGSNSASGQLGDTYTSGSSWFDRTEVFNAGATSTIIKADSTTDYDYIIGDAENIYRDPDVTKFLRHFIFVKPDIIVIADELEASVTTSSYYQWRMRTAGSIGGSNDYYLVSNGDVRMDAHFIHPGLVSFSTGTETTDGDEFLKADFDSTGSDLLATVLHPRMSSDPASSIVSSSFVDSVLYLTIGCGAEETNVELDLVTQEVYIY